MHSTYHDCLEIIKVYRLLLIFSSVCDVSRCGRGGEAVWFWNLRI